MWIETQVGELVNLDYLVSLQTCGTRVKGGLSAHTGLVGYDQTHLLATFETPKQALHAMDRLKKWIASGNGYLGEKPYPNITPLMEANGATHYSACSRVFSFRTLSEDDEF